MKTSHWPFANFLITICRRHSSGRSETRSGETRRSASRSGETRSGERPASLPGVNRMAWLLAQQKVLADWEPPPEALLTQEKEATGSDLPIPLRLPLLPWLPTETEASEQAESFPFEEELEAAAATAAVATAAVATAAAAEAPGKPTDSPPFKAMRHLGPELREIYRQNNTLP